MSMPMMEDDWQAEQDLRTLREAAAIKADQKRVERAKAAGMKMAKAVEEAFEMGDESDASLRQGFRRV